MSAFWLGLLAGVALVVFGSAMLVGALVLLAMWSDRRRERRAALERVRTTLKVHGRRLRIYVVRPGQLVAGGSRN